MNVTSGEAGISSLVESKYAPMSFSWSVELETLDPAGTHGDAAAVLDYRLGAGCTYAGTCARDRYHPVV